MTSQDLFQAAINAPISLGELIDKITILEIKRVNMTGIKLKNVNKELELLKSILEGKKLEIDVYLVNHLKEINNKLWEIEDKIRMKENYKEFDNEFIELARSIYQQNDVRASLKKEINQKYNSELVEEKSYKNY